MGFDTRINEHRKKRLEVLFFHPHQKQAILKKGITIDEHQYGPFEKPPSVPAFIPNIPIFIKRSQLMGVLKKHNLLPTQAYQRRWKETPRFLLKGWNLNLPPTTDRPEFIHLNQNKYKIVYFDNIERPNMEVAPPTEDDPTIDVEIVSIDIEAHIPIQKDKPTDDLSTAPDESTDDDNLSYISEVEEEVTPNEYYSLQGATELNEICGKDDRDYVYVASTEKSNIEQSIGALNLRPGWGSWTDITTTKRVGCIACYRRTSDQYTNAVSTLLRGHQGIQLIHGLSSFH